MSTTTTARPDCHACHGTGWDDAFGSPCSCPQPSGRLLAERDARGDSFGTYATPERNGTGAGRPTHRTDDRRRGPDVAALAAWLAEQTWSTFAASLAESYYTRGYLTPRQHDAAQSMRTKCEARRAERTSTTSTSTPPAALPDVPAGRYAIPSTGANDLAFYQVDRPSDGRWSGYTFVRLIIGGDRENNIPRAQVPGILARIAADPDAGPRYGREIGKCYRCGRSLTDEASRAAGIGPDCARRAF